MKKGGLIKKVTVWGQVCPRLLADILANSFLYIKIFVRYYFLFCPFDDTAYRTGMGLRLRSIILTSNKDHAEPLQVRINSSPAPFYRDNSSFKPPPMPFTIFFACLKPI